MTGSFLREPPASPQVQALYDQDLADAQLAQSLPHQVRDAVTYGRPVAS